MYRFFFKPLFDRLLALLLLTIFAPLLFAVSAMIFLKMGRPIFFQQSRPGKNEKVFTILKFRTMTNDMDSNGNLLPDDLRLKGIGKLVRSTSLDELPQLFNVINGTMSFIGPRPLLVEYLPLYNEHQKRRHEVKPGITGWAQVNGRNAISWEEKFNYDVYYVDHCSLMLDMKIMYMTVQKVLKRSDISADEHVTMPKFEGTKNENVK